jgi:hypothetical protein
MEGMDFSSDFDLDSFLDNVGQERLRTPSPTTRVTDPPVSPLLSDPLSQQQGLAPQGLVHSHFAMVRVAAFPPLCECPFLTSFTTAQRVEAGKHSGGGGQVHIDIHPSSQSINGSQPGCTIVWRNRLELGSRSTGAWAPLELSLHAAHPQLSQVGAPALVVGSRPCMCGLELPLRCHSRLPATCRSPRMRRSSL